MVMSLVLGFCASILIRVVCDGRHHRLSSWVVEPSLLIMSQFRVLVSFGF